MKKKIRLLFFAPYQLTPMNNAPKIRAFNLYTSLRKYCDVTLISRPDINFYQSTHLKKIPHLILLIGQMINEFVQIIKNEHFDAIYIEAFASKLHFFDYIFLNIIKMKKIKIFSFIRDIYWKYPKYFPRTKYEIINSEKELNWYLTNCTGLIFPTIEMSNLFEFKKKYILPPGGDASRCINPKLPNNNNITYVGTISSQMGIDLLLKSMMLVRRKYPNSHCTIVGYGNDEIINKWKNKKFVTFLFNKKYTDIPKILSKTYITVLPFNITPYYNSAIALRLFDYMSSGRPIVATNCKTQQQFINNNKIGITTNDNLESFTNGLIKLIENRNLAEFYGKNGLSAIKKKHSWDHRAKYLIKIIKSNIELERKI